MYENLVWNVQRHCIVFHSYPKQKPKTLKKFQSAPYSSNLEIYIDEFGFLAKIEWRQMPLKWNATYNLIYRTHPMQCWSSKQRHPEADLRLLQHPRWSSILYVTVVLDPPLKTFWILWPYSTRPGKFLRVSHYWETLVKNSILYVKFFPSFFFTVYLLLILHISFL